ncbi:uncharacterized protein LOC142162294 [Nicotiana tabacum]|uniref:Uncharacterized protein LOC142162294 n=1 Tax=Nicotiana tabacum TaxID=4097 RepID=A0AC58RPS1_TOBAC
MFPLVIWTIWINRNNNLYNNLTHKAVLHFAYNQAVEYKLLKEKENVTHQKIPISINWIKLPNNYIKLNIDRSFKEATSLCGFCGLFRDSRGQWVIGFQWTLPGISPLQAELMVLKTGLYIANKQVYTNIEVESDSTDAILVWIMEL